MISMMWNAAEAVHGRKYLILILKKFRKIFKKMVHKKYTIEGTAWYTDQIKLRKYVNKFSKKINREL